MMWRNDTPECVGEYVILVPAFSSPQNPDMGDRPGCTCSAHKAWFDGQKFIFQDIVGLTKSWNGYANPGQCLWTPNPYVFMDGWGENGIKIGWRE